MSGLGRFWFGLSARERVLLAGGGALAVLILVWGLLWVPLQRDLTRLRLELPRLSADVSFMEQNLARIRALAGRPVPRAADGQRLPLLSLIEQQAQRDGLSSYIRQMNAGQKAGEASVRLGAVPFETWLRWADGLGKQGVRLRSVSVARDENPGLVNVRMTVSRDG